MGKEEPVSGNKPAKRTGIDASGAPGMRVNGRVISYNIPEGERPDGIKVRYKIRIATGKRAKEIDARQAKAIMEVLQWHSQQKPPS
jgi:hypothetical protein